MCFIPPARDQRERRFQGGAEIGHASVQTTLNIYTHVIDASHRQAIEQLERTLFPAVSSCSQVVPKSQHLDRWKISASA
jgi:hypothetical protein